MVNVSKQEVNLEGLKVWYVDLILVRFLQCSTSGGLQAKTHARTWTALDTAKGKYLKSARNEFVEVPDATEDELVRLPGAITANDREIGELSSLKQPVGRISFSGCAMRANHAVNCT